ncbi:MAG: Type II secretion system protein E [candidate division WS2 bacterium]|nr:Type II secretion system protein E [Candidatus Psychracetigena formicireducens]
MRKGRKTLGEILNDMEAITVENLIKAYEVQKKEGGSLADVLTKLGLVGEETLARALSIEWNIPFVNLNEIRFDEEIARMLPEDVARKYLCLPIGIEFDDSVAVVISDPANLYAEDAIKAMLKKPITWGLSTKSAVKDLLDKLYGVERSLREASDDLMSMEGEVGVISEQEEDDSSKDLKEKAGEAPIIRLANLIMTQAFSEGASDIHLEPQRDHVLVRQRIDGMLYEMMKVPKKIQSALVSRFKIISALDIAERRLPQDGRINVRYSGKDIDLRVSTLPKQYGEKIVCRILDKSKSLISLSQLGFTTENQDIFTKMIEQPYGMILVTGPTGSGKTTTLYAVLNHLNSPDKNLISVEDPVEYELKGINQVGVNAKVGLMFSNLLRTILRQDPDIIMVGEIRDSETSEMAMQAALTGHLVLSTLHTNDAFSAPPRLIDMGIEPYLIASSLLGVTAQRLARTICKYCEEPDKPPEAYISFFEKQIQQVMERKQPEFKKGIGCPKCRNSGYLGRIGVHEVMKIDDDLRTMIIKNSSAAQIREVAIQKGCKTMLLDLLYKACIGKTSLEEVFRVISTVEV